MYLKSFYILPHGNDINSAWLILDTLFLLIFFVFFRTAPMAYGGSQARGQIGATTAGLHTATTMWDLT